LSPEERIRLLELRGSAYAAVTPEERAEEAAAAQPVDEQANAQGDPKKARVNSFGKKPISRQE
jgi:hypothetical protein